MAITYNGNAINNVTFNGNNLNKVTYNGNTVWEKPSVSFTLHYSFEIPWTFTGINKFIYNGTEYSSGEGDITVSNNAKITFVQLSKNKGLGKIKRCNIEIESPNPEVLSEVEKVNEDSSQTYSYTISLPTGCSSMTMTCVGYDEIEGIQPQGLSQVLMSYE